MANFYVYIHRYASGPKIGEIFYVGKGCGKRSTSHGDDAVRWLSRAGRVGVSKSNISRCCHGQRKSAYGFKWAFAFSTA